MNEFFFREGLLLASLYKIWDSPNAFDYIQGLIQYLKIDIHGVKVAQISIAA